MIKDSAQTGDFDYNRMLIRKMLTGNISSEEKRLLIRLLDTEAFDSLLSEVMDERDNELVAATDTVSMQAYAKLKVFRELIGSEETIDLPVQQESWWRKYQWYAAAAVIVVLVSSVFLTLQHRGALSEDGVKDGSGTVAVIETAFKEYYNDGQARQSVQLSDGSVVTLGYKSRVRVPEAFSKNQRNVYLEGDAFFEISRDTGRPFTVITDEVYTRVLGTSFKVSQRQEDVEVTVATGKVSVSYLNADSSFKSLAVMLPGDQIRWHDQHLTFAKVQLQEILGWKKGQLIFHKQPLENVLQRFCASHDVELVFLNKGFAEEKISITLEAATSIKKALNILSASTGFDFKIDSVNGIPKRVIIK